MAEAITFRKISTGESSLISRHGLTLTLSLPLPLPLSLSVCVCCQEQQMTYRE